MELLLNDTLGTITIEKTESISPKGVIILAHGAGAGMHHPFMVNLADEISTLGFHAVRFNFPYMETGRKSPGSPKKNIETWELVFNHIHRHHPDLPIFLSGKSYGGRMASHLLAETGFDFAKGIIYFGFPLHAPGRDSKDRADHLVQVGVPQLFLQGTKDKLANIDLIREVIADLKKAELVEIEDADHSFNVPKKLGISKNEMIHKLANLSSDFMKKVIQ